jgi:anion-transporting  ArsA/GET3 family ATPase
LDVNAWFKETRLVACVGSGGVGKTTSAAAMGLWAAVHGRRVIVLTIDPAKRLANSLGLDAMGGEATRIDLSSVGEATGELWAMMLDSRGTFDSLIAAVAPSPEVRERIFSNHIYRHMADALAGSQDYMATEKLHDLVLSGKYDLVILDTPPVKNALDFLESPGRVITFLDERVIDMFLSDAPRSNSWRSRLFGGASAVMYRLLGAVFGSEFLDDFAQFLADFRGLLEGFRKRHRAVLDMLRADTTSFVTICAPNESSIDVATFFHEELGERELHRAGIVVNQVHRCEMPSDSAAAALAVTVTEQSDGLSEHTGSMLLERLKRAHAGLRRRMDAEQVLIDRLRASSRGGGFMCQIPRFEDQVYDLPALLKVGRSIFEGHTESL